VPRRGERIEPGARLPLVRDGDELGDDDADGDGLADGAATC